MDKIKKMLEELVEGPDTDATVAWVMGLPDLTDEQRRLMIQRRVPRKHRETIYEEKKAKRLG